MNYCFTIHDNSTILEHGRRKKYPAFIQMVNKNLVEHSSTYMFKCSNLKTLRASNMNINYSRYTTNV